jgi:segregation and condensation protein B
MTRRIRGLEAALYSAGRPLALEEICPVLGTKSDRVAAKVVHVLHHKYRLRDCALEIVILEDGRVEMKLKPLYAAMVKQFNKKPLLKLGPLKTLSYIAFHQPVLQKLVVEARGSHIYGHLRQMETMGLINRERTEDRSYMITTTAFYGDYFGFSHHPERSKIQLKQIFRELKITKLENGDIETLFSGRIDGLDDLDSIDEGNLADSGDRLTHGLSQYPRTSDDGSH